MALPDLILNSSFGDFSDFQNAVYTRFCSDFCGKPKPEFCGRKLVYSQDKIIGKCSRFWHIVSTGSVEADREVDLSRCERIAWVRYMIDNRLTGEFAYWEAEKRLLIATRDFDYLVVLQSAKNVVILITAYVKEYQNGRDQLRRQYEAATVKRA